MTVKQKSIFPIICLIKISTRPYRTNVNLPGIEDRKMFIKVNTSNNLYRYLMALCPKLLFGNEKAQAIESCLGEKYTYGKERIIRKLICAYKLR